MTGSPFRSMTRGVVARFGEGQLVAVHHEALGLRFQRDLLQVSRPAICSRPVARSGRFSMASILTSANEALLCGHPRKHLHQLIDRGLRPLWRWFRRRSDLTGAITPAAAGRTCAGEAACGTHVPRSHRS